MKKCIAAMIAVFILFSFGGVALAEISSQEYSLDALHMKISVPGDAIVLTRDTKTLPGALASAGVTLEGLQEDYKSGNIYLEAFSSDLSTQTLITMQDMGKQKTHDLQNLSAADLDAFAKNMVNQLNKNNTSAIDDETVTEKYGDYSICRYSGTWIAIPIEKTYQSGGETRGSVEYYTVKNGMVITITENSLTGALSDDQKTALDNMVQSAQFDNLSGFLNLPVQQLAIAAAVVVAVVVLIAVAAGRKKRKRKKERG